MGKYVNADGLTVRLGGESPLTSNMGESQNRGSAVKVMTADFTFKAYPDFNKDADANGVLDSFSGHTAAIPAGATITRAIMTIKAAVTGGTATGIDIGLYKKDGTAIDADGIAAAAGAGGVLSGLTVGASVVCAGALAANKAVGADAAYVKFLPNGTLTAGSGRLTIEYIGPRS